MSLLTREAVWRLFGRTTATLDQLLYVTGSTPSLATLTAAARTILARPVPGAGLLDGLLQRKHFLACPGGTTRNQFGFSGAGTTAGTVASADNANGAAQSFTTSNVSGNVASVTTATADLIRREWGGVRVCCFETPSDLTSIRLLIGVTSASLGSSATPVNHCCVLRYDTGASDTGWVVRTGDGANGTSSSQVAAIAASTRYWLVLVMKASSIEVYLGTDPDALTLVHTATGTLPGASTGVYLWASVTTLTNATRQFLWSHFTAVHK